jgi:hypothetical protein
MYHSTEKKSIDLSEIDHMLIILWKAIPVTSQHSQELSNRFLYFLQSILVVTNIDASRYILVLGISMLVVSNMN